MPIICAVNASFWLSDCLASTASSPVRGAAFGCTFSAIANLQGSDDWITDRKQGERWRSERRRFGDSDGYLYQVGNPTTSDHDPNHTLG